MMVMVYTLKLTIPEIHMSLEIFREMPILVE